MVLHTNHTDHTKKAIITLQGSEVGWKLYIVRSLHENTCKFNGCCHIHEPGCEVKKALEEGKISKMRYDDYCMFYEELAQQKKW